MGSKRQIKILITGGIGNLGSWITRYFIEKGYCVTVLSKSYRDIFPNLDFIQCDISNFDDCKSKLKVTDFDFIIHAASSNDFFIENYAEDALKVNAQGTRNLLEILKNKKLTNFIYFSTFHVYGKVNGEVDETTIPEPKNDYALTHLFAEYYLKYFGETFNIPYTIIRLSNSYGCPLNINSSKWYLVLNDLTRNAFENKKIELKTNGKPMRDFIWMGDVCSVLYKLVKKGKGINEIYNLSSQKNYKMIEIAEIVKEMYKNEYNMDIPIHINKEDLNYYGKGLLVKSEKIRKHVNFNTSEEFYQESKKIIELLKEQL